MSCTPFGVTMMDFANWWWQIAAALATFSNCFCCVDTEESVLSSSDTLCFDDCSRLFSSSASAAHAKQTISLQAWEEGSSCCAEVDDYAKNAPVFWRAACCVYCSAVWSSDFSDTKIPIVWMWTYGEGNKETWIYLEAKTKLFKMTSKFWLKI